MSGPQMNHDISEMTADICQRNGDCYQPGASYRDLFRAESFRVSEKNCVQ